jgi:hypothetical protein
MATTHPSLVLKKVMLLNSTPNTLPVISGVGVVVGLGGGVCVVLRVVVGTCSTDMAAKCERGGVVGRGGCSCRLVAV